MSEIDHINISRIDLNLLVAFDALVEEGQVTRAAQRLGIGQSAMSHNLKRLRALFGDELLVRSNNEMTPTAIAQDLAKRIRPILAQLQTTMTDAAVFEPSTAQRTFSIGISPSLEIALIPAVLARVRAVAPGVTLSLESHSPQSMIRALDEALLDIAIGDIDAEPSRFRSCDLAQSDGYLCLFDGRRLGLEAPISTGDFISIPHVTVKSVDQVAETLDRHLAALGLSRQIALQTPHVLAVPYLLKEMKLIALLCRRTALICAERFGLETSALPFDLPNQQVRMVWQATRDREPGQLWLRGQFSAAADSVLSR
ncbi:MAG: LysR family transcriptional regulator [Gammaproteobacteria bacterium]